VAVQWETANDDNWIYVDGDLVKHKEVVYNTPLYSHESVYHIGATRNDEHGFIGGIDDVRLWADNDGFRSDEYLSTYDDQDLIKSGVDLIRCPIYLRFDDYLTNDPVVDGSAEDPRATNHGAEYQTAFGELDEVQYSLGSGESVNLKFDISGRLDTELARLRRRSFSTRRSL
jgi:hypothetical protein